MRPGYLVHAEQEARDEAERAGLDLDYLPDRDEPPPERATEPDPAVQRAIERQARAEHVCEACPDCIHDGHKCCGCYDGACCRTTTQERSAG